MNDETELVFYYEAMGLTKLLTLVALVAAVIGLVIFIRRKTKRDRSN